MVLKQSQYLNLSRVILDVLNHPNVRHFPTVIASKVKIDVLGMPKFY